MKTLALRFMLGDIWYKIFITKKDAFSEKKKKMVLEFYALSQFQAINFLLFKDILLGEYKISISYSSLFSILKNARFQSSKKKNIRHHTHRRKEHPDKLIQIDATPLNGLAVI